MPEPKDKLTPDLPTASPDGYEISDQKINPDLDGKLDELENLLAQRKKELKYEEETGIPILEDLYVFSDEDNPYQDEEPELPMFDDDDENRSLEIADIIDSMEDKIAEELDTLLNLLKDSLKENVMDELKSRLMHPSQDEQDSDK